MDWVDADDSIFWQINTKEPDSLFPIIIIMVQFEPMGHWRGGGGINYIEKCGGALDCGEMKKGV